MALNGELRQFVIDSFMFGKPYEGFADDDSFIERGIIDSTAVMELVAFLEERYQIKLQDQDLIPDNLDSINGLARFVTSHLPSDFAGVRCASRIALETQRRRTVPRP
jgi:acyl carrier protein